MYLAITELLSGLALFLVGMKFMSENLQQLAGNKLRDLLDRFTKKRVIGVIVGALFTAFIQSSGATTVMEVGFVNSGVLALERTVGLTLGAEIGTSITSQLVSLKLTAVAPFIIFTGAAILTFSKKIWKKKVASVIFGFGALFTGINFMTGALQGLAKIQEVQDVAHYMSFPLIAVAVGLVSTLITQSSSVTVSVMVLLSGIMVDGHPLVPLSSCLFFMLGAYVGSCTPAIIASLHANTNAKRAVFVYVMFNIIGLIVLGTVLLFAGDQIADFFASISSNAKRAVANADTSFKLTICVLGLIAATPLLRLSKKVIKSKTTDEEEMHLQFIDSTAKQIPATVVVEITNEIKRMADMVRENLVDSMEGLLNNDREKSEKIAEREKYIDFLSRKITEYMLRANKYELPLKDTKKLGEMFHVVIDIERIGDHAVNFLEDAWKEKEQHIEFSEEGTDELREMYETVLSMYDMAIDAFVNNNENNLESIDKLEDTVDDMEDECQKGHIKRMNAGKCSIESGLVFTDLVIGLERVADHCQNIAYSIKFEDDRFDD
ncbi:MAG: Na/Pi cotransporter family protein [Eubacterium sp.]|nr:Na/Pi cotransporter family protein [Eubacterium sp.]